MNDHQQISLEKTKVVLELVEQAVNSYHNHQDPKLLVDSLEGIVSCSRDAIALSERDEKQGIKARLKGVIAALKGDV